MPRPAKQINELTPGLPEKPGNLSEPRPAIGTGSLRRWKIRHPSYSRLRAAITQAAVLQADLETAWADIQENGRYIVAKSGARKLNPAVADMHTSRKS